MEQVMRNIERARALRIHAIVKADRDKRPRTLSAYFASHPAKTKPAGAKRRAKAAA